MKIIRRSFRIEMSEHEYNIMRDALSLLRDIDEELDDDERTDLESEMTEPVGYLLDNFATLVDNLNKDL